MAREASNTQVAASDRRVAARERLAHNPFFVLGLAPDAARAEVEREGQKLLGMLELGLSGASRYRSPLGEHERTPERVREALAELRDPDRRLIHELWARHAPACMDEGDEGTGGQVDGGASERPTTTRSATELESDAPTTFPGLSVLGLGRRGR